MFFIFGSRVSYDVFIMSFSQFFRLFTSLIMFAAIINDEAISNYAICRQKVNRWFTEKFNDLAAARGYIFISMYF